MFAALLAAAVLSLHVHAPPPFAMQTKREPIVPSACTKLPAGNPFASPTSSVDVVAPDAFNIGAGSNHGCVTPQNEPTIAVNPLDSQNIIVGSNDYRLCCAPDGKGGLRNDGGGTANVSQDGGRTWHTVILPGLTFLTGGKFPFSLVGSAGDPAVAFGPDGVAYYSNIEFSRTGNVSLVSVSRSLDGGETWQPPSLVAGVNDPTFFLDKDWIAVGPGGTVYVTFTAFVTPGEVYLASPILLATSKAAQGKWRLSPITNDMYPYNQGSIPQVAPNGRLYVAFESADPSTGYRTDAQVIATRGKKGFRYQTFGRVYDDLGCYPQNKDKRSVLTGENFRMMSLPAFAVDPVTGQQALVWADNPSCDSSGTHNVVHVITGQGEHYSRPFTLETSGEAVFPSVAAYNGKVAVGYYTRGYAADGVSLDYAFSTQTSGWQETRLTEQSSDPGLQFDGSFIGDYTAAAYGSDGSLHFAWTDFRGNPLAGTQPNQDIFVGPVSR